MDQKEIEEFLIRFGGAMKGALETAAFEGHYTMGGRGFPHSQLHPNLAPTDNLIVGGLSIPAWVIGALVEDDAEKKGDVKTKELGKSLKIFGEGDAIYSLNMVLHHSLIRTIPNTWVIEQRVAASRGSPSSGAGAQRTDVGHRIIKL